MDAAAHDSPCEPGSIATGTKTPSIDEEVAGETMNATMPRGKVTPEATEMELYPLANKPRFILTFALAFDRSPDLFDLLGGDHGRR
ncbi:MAG TPA: hypothetical protein VFT22_12890 [Kofleriaceae bacterium]|nr:hypothetical protein [Kofleriaceae bacterium]